MISARPEIWLERDSFEYRHFMDILRANAV